MGLDLINKYRQLHMEKKYGVTSPQYIKEIQKVVDKYSVDSVLDYGCGQSHLIDELENIPNRYRYDPAIIGIDVLSTDVVDLVICTDVMEHIPKEEVDKTLHQIREVGRRGYFQIALFQHGGRFDDGEPLHCTVESRDWWREQLKTHFPVVEDLPVFRKPRAKKEWAGFLVASHP